MTEAKKERKVLSHTLPVHQELVIKEFLKSKRSWGRSATNDADHTAELASLLKIGEKVVSKRLARFRTAFHLPSINSIPPLPPTHSPASASQSTTLAVGDSSDSDNHSVWSSGGDTEDLSSEEPEPPCGFDVVFYVQRKRHEEAGWDQAGGTAVTPRGGLPQSTLVEPTTLIDSPPVQFRSSEWSDGASDSRKCHDVLVPASDSEDLETPTKSHFSSSCVPPMAHRVRSRRAQAPDSPKRSGVLVPASDSEDIETPKKHRCFTPDTTPTPNPTSRQSHGKSKPKRRRSSSIHSPYAVVDSPRGAASFTSRLLALSVPPSRAPSSTPRRTAASRISSTSPCSPSKRRKLPSSNLRSYLPSSKMTFSPSPKRSHGNSRSGSRNKRTDQQQRKPTKQTTLNAFFKQQP